MDIRFPTTRLERLIDRARHLYHTCRLPRRRPPAVDWDPSLLDLLVELLDDD